MLEKNMSPITTTENKERNGGALNTFRGRTNKKYGGFPNELKNKISKKTRARRIAQRT